MRENEATRLVLHYDSTSLALTRSKLILFVYRILKGAAEILRQDTGATHSCLELQLRITLKQG